MAEGEKRQKSPEPVAGPGGGRSGIASIAFSDDRVSDLAGAARMIDVVAEGIARRDEQAPAGGEAQEPIEIGDGGDSNGREGSRAGGDAKDGASDLALEDFGCIGIFGFEWIDEDDDIAGGHDLFGTMVAVGSFEESGRLGADFVCFQSQLFSHAVIDAGEEKNPGGGEPVDEFRIDFLRKDFVERIGGTESICAEIASFRGGD